MEQDHLITDGIDLLMRARELFRDAQSPALVAAVNNAILQASKASKRIQEGK